MIGIPKIPLAPLILALALLAWAFPQHGQAQAQAGQGEAQARTGEGPGEVAQRRPLTVYTAMTATTAQLPLLAALKAGWPEGAEVKVEYWKNLEDLRALVLAGKGDVWVGHLETLSRAAARGAPACLVAVTVWRKFYFVSAPLPTRNGPNRATAHPADVTELLGVAAKNSITVTSSPQNSPQANLLEELKGAIGAFPTESLPPQQLILELVRGQRQIALMPEPMASMAVSKSPNLKIIGSLEEEYSKHFGGDGLMPQAGVAVNLELASSQPGLVADLLAHMLKAATDLEGKPVSAKVALFPPEVAQAVGPEVLSASLSLEPLIVKAASEVKDQVTDFLILAAPDLFEPGKAFPPNFYWDMAGSQGQPGSPASDAR